MRIIGGTFRVPFCNKVELRIGVVCQILQSFPLGRDIPQPAHVKYILVNAMMFHVRKQGVKVNWSRFHCLG
jgi:hypothetical protein